MNKEFGSTCFTPDGVQAGGDEEQRPSGSIVQAGPTDDEIPRLSQSGEPDPSVNVLPEWATPDLYDRGPY